MARSVELAEAERVRLLAQEGRTPRALTAAWIKFMAGARLAHHQRVNQWINNPARLAQLAE
jgi:hypothetical protein